MPIGNRERLSGVSRDHGGCAVNGRGGGLVEVGEKD